MAKSHKLSTWQAGSWRFDKKLEDEVRELYLPGVINIKRILRAARLENIESDIDKRAALEEKIEKALVSLGLWTLNWRRLSGRPTPARRKEALKKIQMAAHKLNKLLAHLDSDTAGRPAQEDVIGSFERLSYCLI